MVITWVAWSICLAAFVASPWTFTSFALGVIVLFFAFLLTWVTPSPTRPEIYGGSEMQNILRQMPTLSKPQARIQPPAVVQLALVALTNILGRCPHTFDEEVIVVELEGRSAIKQTTDKVALHWLHRPALPHDTPIVIVVPGLANSKDSLPGHSLYDSLVSQALRVVVYEKRGVGTGKGNLKSPIFHFFGHPSDLHQAMHHIHNRYPEAALHFVTYSAGNGLVGSYLRLYGTDTIPVKSSIMLMGGEDYNKACKMRDSPSFLDSIIEARLVQFCKNYYLRLNEEVLKEHNEEAYEACLRAESLHDLYSLTMRHFSGYEDSDEADQLINGFRDGNAWFKKNKIPVLAVYTADDPVAWQLTSEWLEVVKQSPKLALARFRFGNHCACYEGLRLSRWIDSLVIEWLQAAVPIESCRSSSRTC